MQNLQATKQAHKNMDSDMLLIAYGTRPEYIKIKPLINVLKVNRRILFTGQHEDIAKGPADIFIKISTRGNRLDDIVQSILGQDRIFKNVNKVLVQGDTTSAFAVALASFHRRIPIIHLEAGLRTHNLNAPYPEEFNRVAIDRMSSVLLCPTIADKINLSKEGITTNVYVTGNTGLDNLIGLKTSYTNTVFCTMHRRENLPLLKEWFLAITEIASEYPNLKFIIPLHPNPLVQKAKKYLGKNIDIRDPMSHDTALDIMRNCRYVITDSGGVQEEASFLKKRAFVCRQVSERTACLRTSSILCPSPNDLISNFKKNEKYIIKAKCPYGDGHASKRIARIIENA